MPPVTEKQVVFAVSAPDASGVRTLVLGVTREAWDYMKDGKTHTFAFTKAGLPWNVMMFGGADHATVMNLIQEGVFARGMGVIDERNKDFRIEDLPPEELERRAEIEEAEAARLAASARRRRRAARNIRVERRG